MTPGQCWAVLVVRASPLLALAVIVNCVAFYRCLRTGELA